MGHIRLTVQAGSKSEEINLSTPFDESDKDEAILSALKRVAEVKDAGAAEHTARLAAEHTATLDAIRAEVKSLRDPIIARVVLSRTKQIAGLDASKEVEFYAGVSTERLLLEDAHYTGSEQAPRTTDVEPTELTAPDDAMI